LCGYSLFATRAEGIKDCVNYAHSNHSFQIIKRTVFLVLFFYTPKK
jgi:hypothetical protein